MTEANENIDEGRYLAKEDPRSDSTHTYSSGTLTPTTNTVAQIRKVGENLTPVNVFCILKHDLTQCVLNGLVSWKEIVHILSHHSLKVIWCMKPIYLNAVFWEAHYRDTINTKESSQKGDGQRYLKKILERLQDTFGMPLLLHLMTGDLTLAENLRARKYELRDRLMELSTIHGCDKSLLIHISDDWKGAKWELENLANYVSSHPGILSKMPPGLVSSPIDSETLSIDSTGYIEDEGDDSSSVDQQQLTVWSTLRELVENTKVSPQ